MRNFSTKLILILLLSSLALPFLTVIAQPKTAQVVPTFNIGATGGDTGHWDGVVAGAGFAASDYGGICLEPLMVQPEEWSGDLDDLIPVLASEWVITPWPEEMNVNPDPFINKGGVRAIEFTLRPGVTFHDGSAFNATVAKWNIDRTMVMSGNITGSITSAVAEEWYKATYSYWIPVADWMAYETPTWNITQFLGKPASYDTFGTNYDLWEHYPRIRNVTITEDLASGGKIKVYFNDWTGILTYVDDHTMISMDAYGAYFDEPIYGLGDSPGYPQPDVTGGYPSSGFPGHLIGTGPYRFIEHDAVVLQGGIMDKYDNYWNATALEARGLFDAPELALVVFPYDSAGIAGRNLAMSTGTIDIAYDAVGEGGLNYLDMIANPNVNYILTGIEPTRTFITLNCINETEWKDWADLGPAVFNASDPAGPLGWYGYYGDHSWLADIDPDGTIHVDGINRAMRKAVSYAFNYDTYINVILGGRAIRSGGFLPTGNEYYNPSIPLAYRNLTIARQALIDDPDWGPLVAARNLDITNSTADWLDVAVNNPIWEFKLMWDQANIDIANVFATSINDIGMVCGGPFGAPDPAWEITPDLYTAMFSWWSVNYFTYHGVPTNWPGTLSAFLPALEYYVKSPGLPYTWYTGDNHFPNKAWYNIGFAYNSSVDKWIERAWFSDRATAQLLHDNLTTHFQTYQFSDIMVSESMSGYAINKDWELSGLGTWAFLNYLPEEPGVTEPGVQIPGFHPAALLAIAVVTITGIGYSLKKKTKHVKV